MFYTKQIVHLRCKFYKEECSHSIASFSVTRIFLIVRTNDVLYVPSAAITATAVSSDKTERLVRFMQFSFVSKTEMARVVIVVEVVAVIA